MTTTSAEALLAPDALITAAREQTGLNNFGDARFLDALERYTATLLREGRLHEIGVLGQAQSLQSTLINRLRFEDDLTRNPSIADEDVSDPIIILGLPRTGTTKLQRLLAADPLAQRTEFWRTLMPARIPTDTEGGDPRIAIAEQALQMMHQAFPRFVAAHPTSDAREVDEEIFLQQLTLESVLTAMQVRVPSYLDHIVSGTQDVPYAYERSLLQYLQWQDGGAGGRHWVLKSPIHVGNLDVMSKEFPNATFVHCHRDLTVAVPSFLKLCEVTWEMSTDSPDLDELREQWVPFWAGELDKNVRSVCRSEGRVIDVDYTEVVERPFDVIRTIYDSRGLTLTADAERRMSAWLGQNQQHRFGRHEYSLERFGLTPQQIRDRFTSYLELRGETQ